MFPVPDNLDYQTVFQILGTFEAFSIWKGARAFKADAKSGIADDMSEKFDEEAFAAWCDALKNAKNKFLGLLRIIGRLLRGKISKWWVKAWHAVCIGLWRFARVAHRTLAFLLRTTPLVSIPLLSLSYMLQLGCEGGQFRGGEIVCAFIIAKTLCYGACYVLATLLSLHVKVEVPAPDDNKNIEQ